MSRKEQWPQVSVIIATYNRSKLLRLAVDSVLAQSHPAIEIIVVDDGSTDDTARVMAEYAGQVIYIRQPNRGVEAARNQGFRAASGEYLTFLDDDDLLLPTKLERQARVLDSEPEIGLVYCGYYHIDKDGNCLERVSFLPDVTLQQLVIINVIWSGAPLIRRQCLEKVGLFDEETWGCSADWDMWLRIAQAGYRFACVQEPLGAYRIQPDSMMANVPKLEHGVFAALDKVFSDPELPSDIRAMKPQAYGNTHLWLSWSYYGAGLWNDARRHLTEALTLWDRLSEHPEELLDSLCGDALSVRVSDPLKFMTGVLEHLPPCAAGLQRYQARLIATAYIGLALRNYARGHVEAAQHEMAEAIAARPALLQDPEDFARLLRQHAVKLPVSMPPRYVETVLRNLPPGMQRLADVRSRVLSDVMIARAFEHYYAGHPRKVVTCALAAVYHRPSAFRNRGMVSILLRSLPKLLSREQATDRSIKGIAGCPTYR